MALTRWIISSQADAASPAEDAIVNTLYFNVSGSVDDPDYNSLGNDLYALWATQPFAAGRFLDIRGYNMGDPEPRPQKYRKTGLITGSEQGGARQVALCLSYFADRNLPSQRGRIYTGPWTNTDAYATTAQTDSVLALAPALAGLGGLNVDWSIYSPKLGTNTRITNAWVDNSWDIIRSRKLAASGPRKTWSGNG